jgi:hypothetical protein
MLSVVGGPHRWSSSLTHHPCYRWSSSVVLMSSVVLIPYTSSQYPLSSTRILLSHTYPLSSTGILLSHTYPLSSTRILLVSSSLTRFLLSHTYPPLSFIPPLSLISLTHARSQAQQLERNLKEQVALLTHISSITRIIFLFHYGENSPRILLSQTYPPRILLFHTYSCRWRS